jgi:Ca-activated chloride channel family protein
MVVAIGSQTETVAPLSTDRRAASDAVERLQPWGTTPLYDAAAEAVDAIQAASGRRALIILSDGSDRYSRTTPADLIDHIRTTDVLVYPISVGRQRVPVFAELATVTGGRSFAAADQPTLDRALAEIASDLRFQYLLGYVPARPSSSPGWRSIRVMVNRADVRVRARDGYMAK